MKLTDDELIQELTTRFTNSRKAFSDISVLNHKLVEMNRRLEQSESLKTNFLSNIRSEINNPLNVIIGLAGQLADRESGKDIDVPTLAALIYSEASHLDFQLRNIIVAAELEAGDSELFVTNVNLAALFETLVESYSLVAANKSIQIMCNNTMGELPFKFATDAEKLQVVVANLLANAIEYSHSGAVVELAVELLESGTIGIVVKDSGVGIAKEDQQRIFDRFVQLDTGATRTHLGHGLGLSVVKALVEILQGSIELESAPGCGTVCKVILPSMMADDDSLFADSGNLFMFDDMDEV